MATTKRKSPLTFLVLLQLSAIFVVLHASLADAQKPGILTIKDGYFWDPGLQKPYYAKGIAYQTWIADLGEWQTDEQIEWDLREIAKMGANSVRVDFVWKHIEVADNVFVWDRYDYLVDAAERNGLRIFALIGYQWPPTWFKGQDVVLHEGNNIDPGWMTMHPPGPFPAPPFEPIPYNYTQKWVSDIMSFEHPAGRKQYQDFLAAVGNRYKNRPGIGAWIVGNEFGYIGLWSYRQDGYDASCQAAYRKYLKEWYKGDIVSANKLWGTNYASFDQVPMPPGYNRNNRVWADVVQWRMRSVGDFIGAGAAAVRKADPNHMLSYSTVGMIWGPEDWRYHAENVEFIANSCREKGAPLSFMSINNYPNGMTGDELRSGKWGFAFSRWKMSMPVMLSETGFTSTENLFPVSATQSELLRNTLWESVIGCGSIGIHIFTWPYRQWLTVREQGFGIVTADRIFSPAVDQMRLLFNLIDQYNFEGKWLPGSQQPAPDVAFYWSNSTDQMYNRYQANMQAIWGPLERLGFEPRFMSKEELLAGEYKKVKAIIFPRNQRLDPGDLLFVQQKVLPAGVHVFADADLPGIQDYHIRQLPDFRQRMLDIFGIQVLQANVVEDTVTEYYYGIERFRVDSNTAMAFGSIPKGTSDIWWTWKFHNIKIVNATKVSTVRWAKDNWQYEHDGLAIKSHGTAKAAISSFAMGDLSPSGVAPWELPDKLPWLLHYKWFYALFRSAQGFNIPSALPVAGSGYVMVDQRRGGTVPGAADTTFATITNWSDDTTETVTCSIPAFKGKVVTNLYTNKVVEANSDGLIKVTLKHNDMVVLKGSPTDAPNVLIISYPTEVSPMARYDAVVVNYNAASYTQGTNNRLVVQLVETKSNKVVGTGTMKVTGRNGQVSIPIYVPSPTQGTSTWFKSTDEGGVWRFRVQFLNTQNAVIATTSLQTYLSWGLKPSWPLLVDAQIKPKAVITNVVKWEHLHPLDRIEAFPGRVLVYYSSKTAAIDWAHGEKTGNVVTWLESMGYQKAYLGPLTEEQKRAHRLYFMLSDDMKCNYSLCGTNGKPDASLDGALYNLNAYYLITSFKTIILPGVYVMNDQEVNNLKAWLTTVPDAKLISTEGGVGRLRPDGSNGEARLRDIFGMTGTAQAVQTNYNMTLAIKNVQHVINRAYTRFYNPTSLPASMKLYTRIGTSYFWPTAKTAATVTVLGSFVIQGESVARPALIVNKVGATASTFIFNFDPAIYNQLNDTKTLKSLTNGLHDWMLMGRYANALDWQLMCPGQVLTTVKRLILTGSGTTTVSTTIPATLPCPAAQLFWRGMAYPWEVPQASSGNARVGFFQSRDPAKNLVAVQPAGTQLKRSLEEEEVLEENSEETIQLWEGEELEPSQLEVSETEAETMATGELEVTEEVVHVAPEDVMVDDHDPESVPDETAGIDPEVYFNDPKNVFSYELREQEAHEDDFEEALRRALEEEDRERVRRGEAPIVMLQEEEPAEDTRAPDMNSEEASEASEDTEASESEEEQWQDEAEEEEEDQEEYEEETDEEAELVELEVDHDM